LYHNVFDIFANALSVVDAEIDIKRVPTNIIFVNAAIAKLHLITFLLCMLPYEAELYFMTSVKIRPN
jgi:hypothetical protein